MRQPVVIFFSAAYFAAASLTIGAMMESSAVIQSDVMFHFLPSQVLDPAHPRALVVGAGHLHRLHVVLEPELLEAFRSQVEVFEAPPDLLAHQWLFAESLLRRADGFNAEHGIDQAADVKDLASFIQFRGVALALIVEIVLQILVQLELARSVLEGDGVVSLGTIFGRSNVLLRTRP